MSELRAWGLWDRRVDCWADRGNRDRPGDLLVFHNRGAAVAALEAFSDRNPTGLEVREFGPNGKPLPVSRVKAVAFLDPNGCGWVGEVSDPDGTGIYDQAPHFKSEAEAVAFAEKKALEIAAHHRLRAFGVDGRLLAMEPL